MPDDHTYALYAWGDFAHEVGLDRLPHWLDPAALRGERMLEHPDLAVYEAPLRVDVSRSLFDTGDGHVEGRDFTPSGASWRIAYFRLATDGTLDDAVRAAGEIEQQYDELYRDPDPTANPLPVGEAVTVWEDDHGQWDLAIVRL